MATDLWGATITLGAGALLVLIVIGQKTLLAWPQGLLNTQAAEALAVLANGFTSHAGMSATMLIAFAAIPAVLSLRADIELAADIATKEGPNDKREWLEWI